MSNGVVSSGSLVKRARPYDEEDDTSGPATKQIAISSANGGKSKGLVRSVQRTSRLQAPIVSLTGAHSVSIGPEHGCTTR